MKKITIVKNYRNAETLRGVELVEAVDMIRNSNCLIARQLESIRPARCDCQERGWSGCEHLPRDG